MLGKRDVITRRPELKLDFWQCSSIVASFRKIVLSGKVVIGDLPESGVLALISAAHRMGNVSTYRFDQTDSDGTFTLRGLSSGEYLIFAFDGGEPGDYSDLEVVRRLLPMGRQVTMTGAATPDVVMGLTGP